MAKPWRRPCLPTGIAWCWQAGLLEDVQALAQERHCAGDRVLCVPTDVSDPVAVKQLFAQAVQHFGRVDLYLTMLDVATLQAAS